MSARNNHVVDLPGVPEPVADDSESDDESTAVVGGSPPGEDESPYEKLYIAIDGLTVDDFTDGELEALRNEVCNAVLLDLQKAATGVRILSDEANVIELPKDQ